MNIMDRILLTIYTLIIILISLAVLGTFIAIGVNAIPMSEIETMFPTMDFNWQFFLIASIVALLFLIVSFKLLFTGSKTKPLESTLLKHTNLGMIRISVDALEVITKRAVRDFDEVKDVKIRIIPHEDTVRVDLKILAMPDVVLPELTVSVQEKVKEYIESYSGVLVSEVFVYIDNLSVPEQRPRVQ